MAFKSFQNPRRLRRAFCFPSPYKAGMETLKMPSRQYAPSSSRVVSRLFAQEVSQSLKLAKKSRTIVKFVTIGALNSREPRTCFRVSFVLFRYIEEEIEDVLAALEFKAFVKRGALNLQYSRTCVC